MEKEYQSLGDHELMASFNDGDVDAFTELYQRHLKGLLNFFYRLSWDFALSEDLAQEVVVRIFKMRTQWSPNAKFTTFLYRVARNLWIDHVRSAYARKSRTTLNASAGSNAESSREYIDLLPSDLQPPEDDIARRELYTQIMAALDELPYEQRMVFVLAEIDGMKYADVAEVMDVPVGTVKSRMHSAVSKLQGLLEHLSPRTAEKVDEIP